MPIVIANPSIPVTYSSIILGTASATPIGYWSGDVEAGLTMTDLTTNGYDLTRPADTDSVTGKVNEAISWSSGVTNNAAIITSTSFAAGTFTTTGWSAEAWVYKDDFSAGAVIPMIRVYNDGGTEYFKMGVQQLGGGNPYKIQLNNSGVVATTGNLGSLGSWEHIAVTYNISTTTGKIYLNGSEVLSGGVSDSGDTTVYDTIVVGADPGAEGFRGDIDELVVYDGVLSAADVLAHYNAGI